MAITTFTSNVAHIGVQTNALDLTTPINPIEIVDSKSYTNGTGSNQANEFWSDQRTLTGGQGGETLDIAGGLTNAFGQTITFTKVKELKIFNTSTTSTENLTLSGTFMDVLTGGSAAKVVAPGGVYFERNPIDGFAVGAGSSDEISVFPGDDTITYNIAILGTIDAVPILPE